jgi:hypothetical protein
MPKENENHRRILDDLLAPVRTGTFCSKCRARGHEELADAHHVLSGLVLIYI